MLAVRGLQVTFSTEQGAVHSVNDVSFDVRRDEVLGIVGESGSGKTTTANAMLGLLPEGTATSGEVRFGGRNLLALDEAELTSIRGAHIGSVPQDALAALNPVRRIGDQIAEAITAHDRKLSGPQVRDRVHDLLDQVGIPDPAGVARRHPHELSGGMRQRVVIAIAIANDPDVLIADEPTSALDVTVQAQVLQVLTEIRRRRRAALVLITHDLGILAGLADRVAVMYAGRVVEIGDVRTVFDRSAHPYTRRLLESLPRPDRARPGARLAGIAGHPPSMLALPSGCAFHPRCPDAVGPEPCATIVPPLRAMAVPRHASACHFGEALEVAAPKGHGEPVTAAAPDSPVLLEVEHLVKHFRRPSGRWRRWGRWSGPGRDVHAVCDVSFDLRRGETLGLAGESGCGKTTTARLVLNLLPATAGAVRFAGDDIFGLDARRMRAVRRRMQVVFQDPFASLNPRKTAGSIVAAPLRVHGLYRDGGRARVAALLEMTGLDPRDAARFPHEFSGGQRQRIGIARALALEPDLVVLDEPLSALDVSVRAGIVNLLQDLQDQLGLAYLFISHDLSVLRHVAHRVAVMYLGKIVEIGPRDDVFDRPGHPYTQALLSAAPVPEPDVERGRRKIVLAGERPDPADPPSGCRFRTRCWKAAAICADEEPALVDRGQGHPVACHFADAPPVDVA